MQSSSSVTSSASTVPRWSLFGSSSASLRLISRSPRSPSSKILSKPAARAVSSRFASRVQRRLSSRELTPRQQRSSSSLVSPEAKRLDSRARPRSPPDEDRAARVYRSPMRRGCDNPSFGTIRVQRCPEKKPSTISLSCHSLADSLSKYPHRAQDPSNTPQHAVSSTSEGFWGARSSRPVTLENAEPCT